MAYLTPWNSPYLVKIGFAILFVLAGIVQIQAQSYTEMGSKRVQNFSHLEYKANPQNWAIGQNKDGLIYVGNSSGMLEYDGANWRTYTVSNFSIVYSLDLSEDGKVYVGAQNELGYFLADSLGNLVYYSLMEFIPEQDREFSNVWQTIVAEGKVYFRTSDAIFIWNTKTQKFTSVRSESGFHKMFYSNERFFVRELDRGLSELKNDMLSLLSGGEQFLTERIYAMIAIPGKGDQFLVCTRTMGQFVYSDQGFKPFKTEVDNFLKKNAIYSGISLSDKTFLLGTTNAGAVIIDTLGNLVRSFSVDNGITNNSILNVFQDKSGAIWLATEYGISRVDYSSPFSYFPSKYDNKTNDIIRHNGVLYLATYNGLYYLEPKTSAFQKVKKSTNQAWFLTSAENDLLVGTEVGLYVVENKILKPIAEPAHSMTDVTSMKHSKIQKNRVFVGSTSGLWSVKKQENKWENEGLISEFNDQPTTIIEERDGTIWVATYSFGVFRVRFKTNIDGTISLIKPEIKNFSVAEGLENGLTDVFYIGNQVYVLTNSSLMKYDKNSDRFVLDESDEMSSVFKNKVRTSNEGVFQQSEHGNLWIGDKNEVVYGVKQANEEFEWESVLLNRFAEEGIYKIYEEANGTAWISKGSEITKYEPKKLNSAASNFSALIRKVIIGEDSTIYFGSKGKNQDEARIDFKHNSLTFRYAATSYEEKNSNQFKTKLVGFDERESAWSHETKREFTNLEQGFYTFQVRAKNLSSNVSEIETFRFVVMPPWYRTWWAFALYGLALLFSLVSVSNYQRKRVMKIERERAENERKAEALEHAKQIEKAYHDLEKTHEHLKSTQTQLIHAEKMASLGELTAGIAHEIQNPLNFVNNFSELSTELVSELVEELEKGDVEEAKAISTDIRQNLEKITHHGKRADSIVKGMLQHSRKSSNIKEETDINALCDEFFRLAYHGLRAKDKSFNAKMETNFDPNLQKINVVSQEIGRVILNVISNAFYAVGERKEKAKANYEPFVRVFTKKKEQVVEIKVIDNGTGIPKENISKIVQPFFTTKPSGKGTGLGLSMSFDILRAHGGNLDIESEPDEGTTVIIQIPII